MAIAFARVSIHSRSKGHSAVAASAYRTASRLVDERTGIVYDFTSRKGVMFAELLVPSGTDEVFQNREFLWNQVEAIEKRKDAQVGKDVVLALPKELNANQHIELAKQFAERYFIKNGLPVELAIHDQGDGNPHAHLFIPTRRLEKNCFSKYKARDLNPSFAKGRVIEEERWGELWREAQTEYFAKKNIDLAVDLNHIIPEQHRGTYRDSLTHYQKESNQLIQKARQELVLNDSAAVIAHLAKNYSVFTKQEVQKLLFKTFKSSQKSEDYLSLVEQVMAHREVIQLGEDEKGKLCFTTHAHYSAEAKLLSNLEHLMQKTRTFAANTQSFASKYHLSEEQTSAFNYLVQSPDISVIIGRPGTGKSYLLKPVKEYFEAQGCQVIGASLAGKVAKTLHEETGIAASTIASLTYRLQKEQLKLTNQHVIIVDEAGMVDFDQMAFLIEKAKEAGSKIILIGDPDQLKPIYKGEIFRGITSITGYMELETIKRQEDLADRQASLDFAKGHIHKALDHYHKKGAIIQSSTIDASITQLINDWQAGVTSENIKESIFLAFMRKTVANLNEQARLALKDKNLLGSEEFVYQGFDKTLQISKNERLLFRQNDKDLGLSNGDLGTVKQVRSDYLEVELDSGKRLVVPKTYQAIDYGYALTVHKAQGMTAQHVKVLLENYWDKHLGFVAMTRHKKTLKLYTDKETHPNLISLKQTLSRSTPKKNVIDWSVGYAFRCGLNPNTLVGRVVNQLAKIGSNLKEELKAAIYPQQKEQRQAQFNRLKTQYPILEEYEKIHNQYLKANRYHAERLEKILSMKAKKIMDNKNLFPKIRQELPKLAVKLLEQVKERNNDKVH